LKNSDQSLARVDHLVFAVPDLEAGIDHVEQLLGVRPGAGGSHPGWGTANAILSLGPGRYLEVIGPDPDQPDFRGERLFGIDRLRQPGLVTWAAKGTRLERLALLDLGGSERIGQALPASRKLAGGGELRWVLTDPSRPIARGLVPFFIDWGNSPHPFQSAPAGVELTRLEFEYPEPEGLRSMLQMLELDLPVNAGEAPAIVATLHCGRGEVTLRQADLYDS
jgi:hypothetical protein